MDKKELMEFILRDDGLVMAQLSLDEEKKQTALLESLVEQMTSRPSGNNWMATLTLDLNTAHDSEEVWRDDPTFPADVNSVVIPAQEIDYEYEIEPGKSVAIEAGLIMDITGHQLKLLRISNTDTVADTMDIILSGVLR